jgi:hypothetical protein
LTPSQQALVQQLLQGSSSTSSSNNDGDSAGSSVGVLDADQVMLLRQLLGLA